MPKGVRIRCIDSNKCRIYGRVTTALGVSCSCGGRVGWDVGGPVPVYNHLWVAIAAEGSGDMLLFCVLVSDGGADFFRTGEQGSDHCCLVGEWVV